MLMAAMTIVVTSCIYQWPDGDCRPAHRFRVSVVTDMNLDTVSHTWAPSRGSEPRRYLMRVFGTDGDDPLAEDSLSAHDSEEVIFEFELPKNSYRVAVWSDRTGLFDTGDFKAVTVDADGRAAKECYSAATVLTPEEGNRESSRLIGLSRPMAEFMFVADDCPAFPIEPGECTVTLSFSDYMPYVFDIMRSVAVDARPGLLLRSIPTEETGGMSVLVEDAVFMASDATEVGVTLTVFGPDGRPASSTGSMRLPLRRGCLTRVTGPFFTAGINGTGGSVGVNPAFDGTYTIVIE